MARLSLPAALALALLAAGCSEDDPGCSSGQAECNGVCRDAAFFQSDAENCGACGVACGFGSCTVGACQCDPAATSCPQGNPRCVDAQNDPLNCGECGLACETAKAGSGCAAGRCACVAPRDDDCGAFCTDTLTDPRSCGPDESACGVPCPLANQVCGAGACACPASLPTACGSACVNTLTDPQNCGPQSPASCGNVCPLANDVCVGGTCTCPASLPDACPARCVSFADDEQNCGGCGTVCPAGSTCTSGQCSATACAAPTPTRCGSTCCAGSECCGDGSACPLAHANGLGQTYLDCGPLDQHTADQARRAAIAWSPNGITREVGLCSVSCVCRETSAQAAVWCYAGSNAKGLVLVTNSPNCLAAACPVAGGLGTLAWH